MRTKIEAVGGAVDKLLAPLVERAEQQLASNQEHSSYLQDSAAPSWDTLKLSDLQHLLLGADASQPAAQQTVQAVRAVLATLQTAVPQQEGPSDTANSPVCTGSTEFQPSQRNALDGLVALISLAVHRRVVCVGQEEAKAAWDQVSKLWHALGLESAATAQLLMPASKAVLASLQMAAGMGQRKVAVKVHRGCAFLDICQQAADMLGPCLLYPAFYEAPRGGDTLENGEGHGPRKELFDLVGLALCPGPDTSVAACQPALFTYNRSAACYFYNSSLECSRERQAQYRCVGWLMGLVLSNQAALGISLPAILFQQLLEGPKFKPSLDMLAAYDPAAAASVGRVASLDDAAFQELLRVEGLPLQHSREDYIRAGVQRLLVTGCAWQAAALAEGFWAPLSRAVLDAWCIRPADLAEMVRGSRLTDSDFRIQDVFRVVLDAHLQEAPPQLIMALWQVLERWPADRKRRFLKFVTATERVPLPGMEVMRIELPFVVYSAADHHQQLLMLPQAHTCDNTLELPDYWESLLQTRGIADPYSLPAKELQALQDELRLILDARLTVAVTHCTSYELDERGTSTAQPSRPATTPSIDSEHMTLASIQADHEPASSGKAESGMHTPAAVTADSTFSELPAWNTGLQPGGLPPVHQLAPIATSLAPLHRPLANLWQPLPPLQAATTPANAFSIPDSPAVAGHAQETAEVAGIPDMSRPASASSEATATLPGTVLQPADDVDVVAAPIVTPRLTARADALPPVAAKPAWDAPSSGLPTLPVAPLLAGLAARPPKAAWGSQPLPAKAHPPLWSLTAPLLSASESPAACAFKDLSDAESETHVSTSSPAEQMPSEPGSEPPADLAQQMASCVLSSTPKPHPATSSPQLQAGSLLVNTSPDRPLYLDKRLSSTGSPRSPIRHVHDGYLEEELPSDGFETEEPSSGGLHSDAGSDLHLHDLLDNWHDEHHIDSHIFDSQLDASGMKAGGHEAHDMQAMQLDIPVDSDEDLELDAYGDIEALAAELNI